LTPKFSPGDDRCMGRWALSLALAAAISAASAETPLSARQAAAQAGALPLAPTNVVLDARACVYDGPGAIYDTGCVYQ
jgi:hypothetical protein